VVSPCGYDAAQARREYNEMTHPPEWESIPAVTNGRVYAFEANSYASRPGPRLAVGVEALARIFHPAMVVSEEAGRGFQAMAPEGKSQAAAADFSRPAHIL
jgi:hypothetical protein